MRDKRVWRRTVEASIGVVAILIAAVAAPIESPSSGAAAWVRSLSPGERITYLTPAAIRQLPPEYRRALYATLDAPEARVSFWKEVFTGYRQGHALTAQGEAALAKAEALLTANTFSQPHWRGAPPAVADAYRSITMQFGEGDARELFVMAGPSVGIGSVLPVIERVRHEIRLHRPSKYAVMLGKIVPILEAMGCNCNVDAGDCYYYQTCKRNGNGCNGSSWGCGTLWLEQCDGLCGYWID